MARVFVYLLITGAPVSEGDGEFGSQPGLQLGHQLAQGEGVLGPTTHVVHPVGLFRPQERLEAVGVTPAYAERLMSPIGLDLGARTPEETAVSICAEVIAARTGRHVPSLRDSSGDIH